MKSTPRNIQRDKTLKRIVFVRHRDTKLVSNHFLCERCEWVVCHNHNIQCNGCGAGRCRFCSMCSRSHCIALFSFNSLVLLGGADGCAAKAKESIRCVRRGFGIAGQPVDAAAQRHPSNRRPQHKQRQRRRPWPPSQLVGPAEHVQLGNIRRRFHGLGHRFLVTEQIVVRDRLER